MGLSVLGALGTTLRGKGGLALELRAHRAFALGQVSSFGLMSCEHLERKSTGQVPELDLMFLAWNAVDA